MKKTIILAVVAMAATIVAGCAQTDLVAKVAVTSFDSVLKAANVSEDAANGGWSIDAPDGTAKFIFSRDFSGSANDVMIETDATPFIDAGLDTAKLPTGFFADGKIIVGQDLGSESFSEDDKKTAVASFQKLVTLKRDKIGYHEELDHYNASLGNGNMFEWAKDMAKNDKDIVFVVDPKIFIDAGVDPAKVEGWVFAKVNMKDASGKPIQVEKFLKPFNLQ